jgi:hypothetical protein
VKEEAGAERAKEKGKDERGKGRDSQKEQMGDTFTLGATGVSHDSHRHQEKPHR